MGAKQSKEELLYEKVNHGNVEGIKTLRYGGAGLEWLDKEGRTPLILACTRSNLFQAAKVLIEMGANVNAYRTGSHAGTPLHHAARSGLKKIVSLLLSSGANPLLMNDQSQTPLDVARARGHSKVVRAIEKCICLFSGRLREINGPTILEAFVPKLVSKKIWAVVLPCGCRNPMNPPKFELAIYPNMKVSHPRTVVALWKVQIQQPNFYQTDPTLIIVDTDKKTRSKFLSAIEGDKQQILSFYNACIGIYQFSDLHQPNFVSPPPDAPPLPNQFQATNTLDPVDSELTTAIDASIQTALNEGLLQVPPSLEDTFYTDSIQYPSIDSSSINDLPMQTIERKVVKSRTGEENGTNSSPSLCVICYDEPVEGAFVPCGHMAGCMSCLKEIKSKKGECPVCRANIEQIVKLFTV